jgi:hypothetical protein
MLYLVSVISDLASRVYATQRHLDTMHLVPISSISATQSVNVVPGSVTIPKRPAGGYGQGCVPHLQDLRADAVDQANRMVDALESSIQGNNSVRALRRGWSRLGGDNVPRVAIPWPQDFICFLTVFDWTQGSLLSGRKI